MTSTLSIKLVFGEDIRKVPVENLTMNSLCDKIKLLYPDLENSGLEDLYLYYIDEDNDKIRIKFDMELSEAFRQTRGTRVLKIFIINLASPPPIPVPTSNTDASIIPFISLLSSLSSIPMLSPSSAALNTSLGSFLSCTPPLNTSVPYSNALSASDFTHINKSTCDSGVCASPDYNSVSTNTLIDAKDVATETPQHSVTQTTQTYQITSDTQTTQTQHYNASCATQTAQNTQSPACAAETQTTQTSQSPACAAETQTTQTSHSPACVAETQTTPALNFYDSLANTQFGSLMEKLHELGFSDKEKCVQALVKYSGKLHEAIDELLLDELLV